jgi:sugar lactone lactonase YvrE
MKPAETLGAVTASIAIAVLVAGAAAAQEPQNLMTVAGLNGDGGPATAAEIQGPKGLAFDRWGNVYFADTFNARIRRVDAKTGIITTVAGTGVSGLSGDGGPANQAQLAGPAAAGPAATVGSGARSGPIGLIFDSYGNLFIGDVQNRRVRKITATVDASGNPQSIVGTEIIKTLALKKPDGSAVTQVTFSRSAAFDAFGNLFFAATGASNAIQKVTANLPHQGGLPEIDDGAILSIVAGNGKTGYSNGAPATAQYLNNPWGLRFDGQGNLLFAEFGNEVIRKITATPGEPIVGTEALSLLVGTAPPFSGAAPAGFSAQTGYSPDGTAKTAALLDNPTDVAFDTSGMFDPSGGKILFFQDRDNFVIRCVNLDTQDWTLPALENVLGPGNGTVAAGTVRTVVGVPRASGFADGPMNQALIAAGLAIEFDSSGNLVIADNINNRIRRVSTAGSVSTVAGGCADLVDASAAQLAFPQGVALDGSGNVFVADSNDVRIRRIDGTSGIITTVAGTGAADDTGDGGPAKAAAIHLTVGLGLFSVAGIALDGSRGAFFADGGNNAVRYVNFGSDAVTVLGTSVGAGDIDTVVSGLSQPAGVVLDDAGNLLVVDSGNDVIRTGAGAIVAGTVGAAGYSGDGGPATSAKLNAPQGIAVDGVGSLFIADRGNNVIRKVAGGTITTFAGTGVQGFSGDEGAATSAKLSLPVGVALDGDGNLFVADMGNSRIRRIDAASGIITTVAGTGVPGFGDGAATTAAMVNTPAGVAFDASGNLFVADSGNNRVRLLTVAAKTVSVNLNADGAGGVEARVELDAPRDGSALSKVRLRTIDPSSGEPTSAPVSDADLGPDPADPTNPRKRVFGFGSNATLAAGQAFRLEGVFTTDGKYCSGAAPYSIAWSGPADITYGTALSSAQLNATASVPGTFTYGPVAGTVLSPGPGQPLTAHFVPENSSLGAADWTVPINVLKATPSITWSSPGDIVYGTPLDGTQLDAAASVPGAFSYGPVAGTVLHAGANQRLEVTFTPTDTTNYDSTTASVAITVTQAPLTITADDKTKVYGAALPTLTFAASGFVNGDTTASLSTQPTLRTTATTTSPVGSYPITASGAVASDYAISYASGTLDVTYGICPLYDQTKMVHPGATLPIEVSLCDANSADVSAAAVVLHATALTLASGDTSGVLAAAGDANPDMDFRFDSTLGPSGGYILNLKTTGLSTGTWLLSFTAGGDPLTHTVSFQVR